MNGFFNLDLATIWNDSKRIFWPEVDFGDQLQQEIGLSFGADAGARDAERQAAPAFGLTTVPPWVWAVGAGLLALLIVPSFLKG